MERGLQLTVLGASGRRYLVLPSRARRDVIFLQTPQGQSYVLQTKQTVRRCEGLGIRTPADLAESTARAADQTDGAPL